MISSASNEVPGSQATLSQTEYPATFRTEGFWLAIFLLLGIVLVAAGLAGVKYTIHFTPPLTRFQEFQIGGSCFGFAIMGALLVASALKSRLVINADSIEDRGVFWTRRFTRSQIAGKKTYTRDMGAYVKTTVIYPISQDRRPMKIEMIFKPTAAFDAWMASIPDVDESRVISTKANWKGRV